MHHAETPVDPEVRRYQVRCFSC